MPKPKKKRVEQAEEHTIEEIEDDIEEERIETVSEDVEPQAQRPGSSCASQSAAQEGSVGRGPPLPRRRQGDAARAA